MCTVLMVLAHSCNVYCAGGAKTTSDDPKRFEKLPIVRIGAPFQISLISPSRMGLSSVSRLKVLVRRSKKKKRKEESSDDDSGDDSDDSEMDRCEDIVAQRFRKMPKSLLKENLKVYKDKTTGTKKELAQRLAENVTNETGSDDSGSGSDSE